MIETYFYNALVFSVISIIFISGHRGLCGYTLKGVGVAARILARSYDAHNQERDAVDEIRLKNPA